MVDGGQPSRSMASFSNQMTREEYLLHKAKIDEARERLAQMELEIELQEAARQGREAEQKLAKMRAAAAQSFSAGPSSASDSNHYPNANYQFEAVHEAPLTARIEGEVQDSPSDSSRPPVQVPLTHYNYQHNYPTISQPQQASFKAYVPQFSTQQHPEWVPFAQTPTQAAARSRKKPSGYAPGSTSTIPRYQHSSTPSSTPSYTYQTMRQNDQSYQQQQLTSGEEYWTRQSQNYMTEPAATGTQPTSSVGVNAQATLLSGTAMPQQPHVQHHMPLPAAPSEAAPAVLSAQRPPSSTETQTSFNPHSSGSDPPNTAITKQEFIRRFQIVSERDATHIRSFLATSHVPLEWFTEAVSSVDPANLKDASAVALLNDVRNRLKISPLPQSISSTSVGTDVRIPTVDNAPSKSHVTSVPPPPPPVDASSIQRKSTSLGTKEKYLESFNEIFRRAGIDKAADFFLRNQSEVPWEWQQALIDSLTRAQAIELHSAWARAKARLDSSSVAKKSDASPNDVPNIMQQNQSQTTTPSLNEVITQPAPTKEFPQPVPVPPRPSVTKSFQSTSAQPPKTSTIQSSKTSTIPNHTTTTTFAASQSTSAPAAQISALTTTSAPVAPLMQPRIATSQRQPPTGTVTHGQAADNFRHYRPYGVPPPMSVPTGNGKHVEYVHDPYLNKYVRRDIANRLPSSSTSSGQQPSIVVPQGISASTQATPQGVSASTQAQATILIPPATPRPRPNGTVKEGRTPHQADKSRLARDILRSLGMDELPVMAAAEKKEASGAKEGAGVLGNLPATTESQEEAAQSQDLAQLFQVAPQDTSLALPPTSDQHPPHEACPIQSLPSDVPMEPERQPPTHNAPQHNSLNIPLPSDVPMEQEKQSRVQATQSPIKAITIDLTMDDETATTAPGDGPTSLISPPPPAVASVPASASTDRDELRRRVNEISPPKSPPPIAISRAASVSMDQHESAHGVNGISIASDMHRPEPSQGGHMDSSISFPTLDEPPPPVSKPTGTSSPAPSFRSQREQSEDVSDEVLPLFLPSPSASPAPLEHSPTPLLPDTDDDVVIVDSMLRGDSPSRRRSDSVMLVSDGEGSLTPAQTVRRKKGQRAYVLVPPPSPGLKRAIKKKRKLEESGIVSGSEEEEPKYTDIERAFMIDCKFRMAERPCQWAGCDALMNSCENLCMHLKLHTQEASSKGLYICRWLSCLRKFKSTEAMEKHLQRHAYFPLPCPLENCPAVFDEPFDAIQHEVRQRTSTPNVGLKPPPNPHLPRALPPKLNPLPHIVPAYRTEPRHIRTARITPQRHSVIGPWVLHNIFSPVEQNLRKQSASMKLRYPRRDAHPEDLDDLRARPDEYDFLASLSIPPTRTIRYDDLDSEGASLTLHEGITFWDTMSESDSQPAKLNSAGEGDADLGEDIVMETTDGGASHSVLVEDSIMSDPDAAISTLDEMYGSQWTTGGGGEEEAVEMML